MRASVAYVTHPSCLQHEMGRFHPESPARLRAISEHLEASGLAGDLHWLTPQVSHTALWSAVHTPSMVRHLQQVSPATGLHWLDGDTALNPNSLTAAGFASGAVVCAIDALMRAELRAAFCAIRPPGHHAEKDLPMGFCLINQIALAVYYLRQTYGVRKVAIVDFDVHHGNGTVDIFRNDPDTLICASYQHPFYPGRQLDLQSPNILYAPLAAGSTVSPLLAELDQRWLPALEAHRPEWILFSAGFDAHRDDPLGGLKWRTSDYQTITSRLLSVPTRHPCRVLSVLEGGYNLDVLGSSVAAHLRAVIESPLSV